MGLKSGDIRQHVLANRNRFYRILNVSEKKLALANQIHSGNVKIVNHPGLVENTDAMICNKKDIFLAIQTADCFPIFLFEPDHKVCGVIHAGWRGVVLNIVENTLETLKADLKIEPSKLLIAIGPGIQSDCFEVRKDVFDYFPEKYLKDKTKSNKRYLDLKSIIIDKLNNSGVPLKNIYASKYCTKCCEALFYSFRRDGEKSGRMLGIIGIT
jgi:YfiH family protein